MEGLGAAFPALGLRVERAGRGALRKECERANAGPRRGFSRAWLARRKGRAWALRKGSIKANADPGRGLSLACPACRKGWAWARCEREA